MNITLSKREMRSLGLSEKRAFEISSGEGPVLEPRISGVIGSSDFPQWQGHRGARASWTRRALVRPLVLPAGPPESVSVSLSLGAV